MTQDRQAKEAIILTFLDNYPLFKVTDGFIDALLRAVEPYSARSVEQACQRFADGAVSGHDNRYVINGPELAEQCRLFDDLRTRTVVPLFSGIIEMDFGHGRVDMRGLTVDEQDRVIDAHGVIDGKNLALLSLEEKQAVLRQEKIDGPAITPRLRTMRDQ